MLNPVLLAIAGALLGGFTPEPAIGVPTFALLGYLFGRQREQSRQLDALRQQLKQLKRRADKPEARAEQPEVKPAQPTFSQTPAASSMAPEQPKPAASEELDWSLPEELIQPAPSAPKPSASAQPIPPPQPEPAELDWLERLLQQGWQWLIGGNPAVKVGLVLLFFGVGFLLRYASEHIEVSIAWRLTGVAAGAFGLLALGWWLRNSQRLYALLLQGGAIGLLYMTVFAALRLYQLLDPTLAFALLCALAVLSATLALRQDARVLASFALAGGFLAPILASTGQGSHVQLFAYYAVLNLCLVTIAWRKHWRELNLLGFAFTFVIGVLWGVNQYRPALLASTEPFLLLFFAIYLAISVRFPLQKAGQPWLDNTLLFGTPMAFTGLQYLLLWDQQDWLALSCLLSGAVYAGVYWLVRQQAPQLLKEALLGIALVLASISIPLALPGDWTAITWALEGALLLRFALLQQRHWSVIISLLLQIGAWISLLDMPYQAHSWLDSRFYCALILSLCLLCSALWLARHSGQLALGGLRWGALKLPLLILGFALWLISWGWQLDALLNQQLRWLALALLLVASTALGLLAARLLRFNGFALLQDASAWLLAALTLIYASQYQLLDGHGLWLWPLLAVGHSALLLISQGSQRTIIGRHFSNGLWLLLLGALVLDQTLADTLLSLGERLAIQLLLFSAISAALPYAPLQLGQPSYRAHLPKLSAAVALVLWLLLCERDPSQQVLSLLPVFNLLDISQIAALVVLWRMAQQSLPAEANKLALGAGFVLLNLIGLRAGTLVWQLPWQLDVLWADGAVQTLLAFLWTAAGMLAMLLSRQKNSRVYWFAGAALLGLTVIKLFAIDLGQSGTLTRIISFIGVGVLLLVIGYLSPLPPSQTTAKEAP